MQFAKYLLTGCQDLPETFGQWQRKKREHIHMYYKVPAVPIPEYYSLFNGENTFTSR
jgi:hypothetical protein